MPRFLTEYDRALAQGMLWTPAVLQCEAWWDGTNGVTWGSTGASSWVDRTGKYTASQSTSANQPTLTSVNGIPCLLFGGSAFMTVTINDHRGVLLVYRDSTTVVWTTFFGGIYDGTSAPYHGNGSNEGPAPYEGKLFSSLYTATETLNGTNRRNGTSIGDGLSTPRPSTLCVQSHIPTAAFTSTRALTHIGCDPFSPPSRAIIGEMPELIVLRSGASTREVGLIEGYFSWKWGIHLAADHPFANRPPLIGD